MNTSLETYKKALLFTDPHVDCRGGSRVFREFQAAYFKEEMFPRAVNEGCDVIICGGDFFDNRNNMSLATIDYIMNEFIPMVEEYKLPLYIIVGNHDIAFKNTNRVNSLSIFDQCEYITIIDQDIHVIKTTGKEIVCCPWINQENEESFLETLQQLANKDRVLIGHFEINGAQLDKSRLCDHGVEPSLLAGYDHVLSGHFHLPSQLGNIEYMGATFHLNWGDYGSWRGYKVYDFTTDRITDYENEFCLFKQLSLEEVEMINDEELKSDCGDMYVKLVVSRETDNLRPRVAEALHRIEKTYPLKVDVLDLTIFDNPEAVTDDDEEVSATEYVVKTPVEYFSEQCDDALTIEAFNEIYMEVAAAIRDQQQ